MEFCIVQQNPVTAYFDSDQDTIALVKILLNLFATTPVKQSIVLGGNQIYGRCFGVAHLELAGDFLGVSLFP